MVKKKKKSLKRRKRRKKQVRKNYKKIWKLGDKEVGTRPFDIDREGKLVVRQGNYQYKIFDLVKRFGTSLEIIFPFIIEERLNEIHEIFAYYLKQNKYKGKFRFHYPMKVNQNKEFVLPIISEGGHIEVGSANELWLIKRLWEQDQFSSRIRVICNGPKTKRYLSLIEELKGKGLEIIPIIENFLELDYLRGYRGDLGVRVDPDLKIKSHWDKRVDQFGFSFQDLLKIGKIRNLKVLHYHASSQIQRLEDLVGSARLVMKYYIKLKKINPSLDTLDIGGGMPVAYEKKKIFSLESAVKGIVKTLKIQAERAGIPHPNMVVEWGRWVVAPAQITIFKILAEKKINRGVAKKWYFVDGSFMNDLLDTWAIKQRWHAIPINHLHAKTFERVWLAGSSCDSDDKYTAGGSYVRLPKRTEVENGDDLYVAFFDTGAYQDALASNHCLLSNPAQLSADSGLITVTRTRETAEDVGKRFGW
ncbi:MAG: hypothetical protein COT91_03675 [Candidatus Doudnabacteria bacterium CG10_big_fil_rev_8_21_14_0_10_41_10]|uniref:arginine decarboxylase n=1 Tax=Candidatus Doudnabacteria bacterium CG10_big_fil_rev_8_21_14_0_10_41_10 TaxID=1974551 RepID=A0A2H0VD32_9BACT|nr:MAG: hypothetical protein COT91_03675 [Candidatus Doudnabacteria bacterium CG10_big_fil_rev_8_21_14_0_10_41_10]